jgi:hypothetical protein
MEERYFETTIGGATVLVQDMSREDQGWGMSDTAAGEFTVKHVDDLMGLMKPVIAGLAGMGEEALSTLKSRPDEVAMTVSMGYSTELNAWVLKGNASLTFDVKVTWKKDSEKSADA